MSAMPAPACGANSALQKPIQWPLTLADAASFICATPPSGAHSAPRFSECCDGPVLNVASEQASCAAFCSVSSSRLARNPEWTGPDAVWGEFSKCLFEGMDAVDRVQVDCKDGEELIEELDRELRKRQDDTSSTTTYDPSFWSSLASAAGTSEVWAFTSQVTAGTPSVATTPRTTTAANSTAAATTTSGHGTIVTAEPSVAELTGTRKESSSTASASAAESSSSGAAAAKKTGFSHLVCIVLVSSLVLAA